MVADGIGALEVRQDVHDAYNERIDAAHERMVWTHPGMSTYYRNDKGRVVVNYPFRNVDLFASDLTCGPRRLPRRAGYRSQHE